MQAATSNSVPPSTPLPAQLERTAVLTAVISGAFCVILCVGMIVLHWQSKADDPLKAPQMAALKEKLAATPRDEQLKEQIRTMDLDLRRHYFQQLSLNGAGGWMLLVGLGVFLLAAKQVHKLRKRPPRPQLKPNAAELAHRAANRARRSVWVTGVVLATALTALGLSLGTSVPLRQSDLEKLLARESAAVQPPGPSPAEYQSNWPRFRGPGGNGIVNQTNLVLEWNLESGAGLLWKTPVPARGFNSPIAWGNQIFLSGGDKKKREVSCFDLVSGRVLWQHAVENVPGSAAELPEIPDQTGFAAATMATDGRRAYVFFANGDLAAFNFDGTLAWAKNLGTPHNPYGHASSLTTWQDRLILQLDQGSVEDRLSRLYAFDGATGNIVWQRQRPVGESWATPIVIEAAGQAQIITASLPWLMAHAAKDGTEIWRAECLEGEVTPSPVFASNVLYVANPSTSLLAIRPDGQGDVSKTHILWSAEDGIPDITSPVSNGELVFVVATYGIVTCYDAKDGKKLWEHDYQTDFNASPTLIGDRLLLFSVDGSSLVVAAAREFKELAKSVLGEKVYACPAFVQGRMIVRGATNLFCFGSKEGNQEKLAKRE